MYPRVACRNLGNMIGCCKAAGIFLSLPEIFVATLALSLGHGTDIASTRVAERYHILVN